MASEPPVTLRVGTRRSPLALKQAELVVEAIQAAHPHVQFEINAMSTMGDVDKTSPLPSMGKGLWTSELEAKLLGREVDVVVHSLKDMPTTLPDGCVLAGVTEREDPRDIVAFRAGTPYRALADLPAGSVVGTSSLRRAAQLRRSYPSLRYEDARGNIDTRLRKLHDPAPDGPRYDAVVLAAAGLLRLDLGSHIAQYLDSATPGGGILHAVGQGALGIEARAGDTRVLDLLRPAIHEPTMLACLAERSVMRTLEGGCSVPIGVETSWVPAPEATGDEAKRLRLRATVVSLDGTEAVDSEMTEAVATHEQADDLGKRIAKDLLEKGAQKILDVVNEARAVSSPPPVGATATVS